MYHTMFEDEETGLTVVIDPTGWGVGWIAKVIDSQEDAQAFDTYDQACDWAKARLS